MEAASFDKEKAAAHYSEFSWNAVTYGVGQGKKSKEILKGISGSLKVN